MIFYIDIIIHVLKNMKYNNCIIYQDDIKHIAKIIQSQIKSIYLY